jgi:Flp pilus assembly protein TadG
LSPAYNSIAARCVFFRGAWRSPSRLRALNGERGSTLVEFALVSMLFFTMLFGIAGFGHALYTYHFVSESAREATRWAIVNGSTCASDSSCTAPATATDIDTYVKNHIPPGINVSNISTAVTYPVQSDGPVVCTGSAGPPPVTKVDNAPGCTVEVTVSYQFNFIFPLLPTNPLTMSSTSEMVIAH